jgi:hypothetical protein
MLAGLPPRLQEVHKVHKVHKETHPVDSLVAIGIPGAKKRNQLLPAILRDIRPVQQQGVMTFLSVCGRQEKVASTTQR